VSKDYSIEQGSRFAFGENWLRFLDLVDEPRIERAVAALADALGGKDLRGSRFLDAGSGSGLSSLAARRLGATVHSFDYDPSSVACTGELRRRFLPDDSDWVVERGSVLDEEYLASLGLFDVVYSWGVLHHTGAMWQALENIVGLIAERGRLYISIYNDQGERSARWRALKRRYVNSGPVLQRTLEGVVGGYFVSRAVAKRLLPGAGRRLSFGYGKDGDSRGMSWWYDVRDWVGGYPFEVAKPEEVISFCAERGLVLSHLVTVGGALGCNEYVFARRA
jgi:2-polyprenyl-6-hydroxyphenyl methylase/3-demethylubiquinone-9 3-methyltransferase